MKAVQVNKYGGPQVLEVKENVAVPTPQKEQVLVKVYAAGLNPFDIKVLSGAYKKMIPLQFPITFGGDFSGVITQIGEGVAQFKAGDEVFGTAIVLNGGSGAYAEYAVANAANISRKPKNASFVEAAALPVAGLTAVEALADQIKVQKGQKILIHGGAGGVGHMAIQYAKSIGTYVATTVSVGDIEFVKKLGAQEVIDYKTQAFEQRVKDYDSVVDTVGIDVTDKSYQVLKRGGVLVLLVSQANETLAQKYGVKVVRQQSKTDTVHLKRLAELVDKGIIKVNIDRTFSLERVREAFTHLETGHPRGKVVLNIKEE